MNPLKNISTIYSIVSKSTVILFFFIVFILLILVQYPINHLTDILFNTYSDWIAATISFLLWIALLLSGLLVIKFLINFLEIRNSLRKVSSPSVPRINDLIPGVYTLYGIQEYMVKEGRHCIAMMQIINGENFFAVDIGNVDGLSEVFFEDYKHTKFPTKVILEGRKHFLPKGEEREYSVLVPYKEETKEVVIVMN